MFERGLFRSCLIAISFVAGVPGWASVSNVAPGVDVIFGSYIEGQQPDGNSVVFTAPAGLIVMDTGRHAEHTQQILDFAAQAKKRINAIINSHWHLDHIGGNSRIRVIYPNLRIYASGALEGALQGFLADYRRDLEGALQKMPDSSQAPAWRDELAIIASAPASLADERVVASDTKLIAGRRLTLNLETRAVTAGDVWVFDPVTKVLAAGDLVTLPVPFLDTACPGGWKDALDHLALQHFSTLVPGHGAPMKRAAFETYRRAYVDLLACTSADDKSNSDCASGWIRDADALIPSVEQQRARKMMEYYVGNVLRKDAPRLETLCGVDRH